MPKTSVSKPNLLQIDAFADRPFAGNSAAVCLLEELASDDWMQAFAAEMNLSETAYVRRLSDDDRGTRFELRWFTPAIEVPLCGHATLAAAAALFDQEFVSRDSPIRFVTKSGELLARTHGDAIELDFPQVAVETRPPDAQAVAALGISETPAFFGATHVDDLLIEVACESIVRNLRPDFRALAEVPCRGVAVTALAENQPSEGDGGYDFVSRFFAPAAGIDEDPVTGSAHCALAPYWSSRPGPLSGKRTLRGYQASRRGGLVEIELTENRALLRGRAIVVFRGEVATPCDPRSDTSG